MVVVGAAVGAEVGSATDAFVTDAASAGVLFAVVRPIAWPLPRCGVGDRAVDEPHHGVPGE
jgi:hypothetical protein